MNAMSIPPLNPVGIKRLGRQSAYVDACPVDGSTRTIAPLIGSFTYRSPSGPTVLPEAAVRPLKSRCGPEGAAPAEAAATPIHTAASSAAAAVRCFLTCILILPLVVFPPGDRCPPPRRLHLRRRCPPPRRSRRRAGPRGTRGGAPLRGSARRRRRRFRGSRRARRAHSCGATPRRAARSRSSSVRARRGARPVPASRRVAGSRMSPSSLPFLLDEEDATRRAARPNRRNHPFWDPLLPVFDEGEASRRGDGLTAGAGVELAQQRRDVAVDGPRRDVEALRDRRVRVPIGEEPQHFELPGRQAR